jgi:hypothetical protein
VIKKIEIIEKDIRVKLKNLDAKGLNKIACLM